MIGREIHPPQKKHSEPTEEFLSVSHFSLASNAGDSRDSLRDLTFSLRRGEILGIAGVEGNGQGPLVEGLLGLRPGTQGEIFFEKAKLKHSTKSRRDTLNFGVISENRHDQSLWLAESVASNCAVGFTSRLSWLGFLRKKELNGFAQNILEPYNVKLGSLIDPISSLSGGNQQKVVVAREVSARKPPLLIASHPTRGVDIGAAEFIHQQIINLRDDGSGILLISSELEELTRLCDRILVLFEGHGVREFEGPQYDLDLIGKAMTGGLSA
jgi:simple sugar transport system ATP-binding protein